MNGEQRNRRDLLLKAAVLPVDGDAIFFPLLDYEKPLLAANRIQSRLAHDVRWSYKTVPAGMGVWVTKISKRGRLAA